MRVELLVTGDEIVRGKVVDTNSAWLLSRLAGWGALASRVSAVGDTARDIESALVEAASRAQVVVVSGGLGPTSDDLTAECAARVAGVPLIEHAPTVERIRARFAARGRPLPPGVERQARVPGGAEVLENDEGTAPGFRLRLGAAECFFFAGVPREFRHLCERHLGPFLSARAGTVLATRTLRCVSIPEAELDALLLPIAARHGFQLGLRATWPESWATFATEDSPSGGASARLDAVLPEAIAAVGHRCYTSRDESLAEVVGRLAADAGARIAVAESCTGGLLGAALTDVPGSSRYVLGGAIAYANEVKTATLGVSPDLLASHGAVSEPVVRAMAEGARVRFGATHALAITGVAGPGGGSPEKPVGTVWVALSAPDGTRTQLLRSSRTDRESVRMASVSAALDLLRRVLLGVS